MKADKDIAYLVTLNLTEAGKYTFFLTETSFVPSSEFITMPGSYQGWNPGGEDCYKLTSPDRNYVYSGAHYMPEGTLFKFHDAGSWIGINGKIAWNAENNGGTFAISINGGENIEMTHGGYYKFIVNTEKKTCKFMQSGWGVVGDATPGDWSKDTWMTYDPETKLWTVTMDMKNGHFKFRWDADWAINFGGDLGALTQGDRKSTRLNSSHANISYAVFCLQKKQHGHEAGGARRGRGNHLAVDMRRSRSRGPCASP